MSQLSKDTPAPSCDLATDPVADKRGLECRWCGCNHFEVLYTRATWGGRIMRRRECRHCGKRMTTWESAAGK